MLLRALATGLCSFCLLTPLYAEEPVPPCGSPVSVPTKPDLEDYPDYTDFLVQIMKYKQARHLKGVHQAACPDDYRPPKIASNDPTVIVEPETLDGALQRTARIEPIDYQRHPTWYDRSTSRSFELPALGANLLSGEHIRTLLGNADSDEPLILPMTIVGMQLDGINDGGEASGQEELNSYQRLPYEEQQVSKMYFVAETQTILSGLYRQGNLTYYVDTDSNVYFIRGVIYGQMPGGN